MCVCASVENRLPMIIQKLANCILLSCLNAAGWAHFQNLPEGSHEMLGRKHIPRPSPMDILFWIYYLISTSNDSYNQANLETLGP